MLTLNVPASLSGLASTLMSLRLTHSMRGLLLHISGVIRFPSSLLSANRNPALANIRSLA